MDPQRERIISAARRQLNDIRQYFADVASWNDNSDARKAGCEPVDPDPTGVMARMATALEEMLANDEANGHQGPIVAPSMSLLVSKVPERTQ